MKEKEKGTVVYLDDPIAIQGSWIFTMRIREKGLVVEVARATVYREFRVIGDGVFDAKGKRLCTITPDAGSACALSQRYRIDDVDALIEAAPRKTRKRREKSPHA